MATPASKKKPPRRDPPSNLQLLASQVWPRCAMRGLRPTADTEGMPNLQFDGHAKLPYLPVVNLKRETKACSVTAVVRPLHQAPCFRGWRVRRVDAR